MNLPIPILTLVFFNQKVFIWPSLGLVLHKKYYFTACVSHHFGVYTFRMHNKFRKPSKLLDDRTCVFVLMTYTLRLTEKVLPYILLISVVTMDWAAVYSMPQEVKGEKARRTPRRKMEEKPVGRILLIAITLWSCIEFLAQKYPFL